MRKIEKAPNWFDDKIYNEALNIRAEFDLNDLVQSINNDYLYWDKVKYKKTLNNIEPRIIWTIVKLSRILTAKNIKIGNNNFKYNVTDYIQKGLHEFDLNFGGNLSSESIVSEEDKKRYLVSSIMEEAIASSQIEGAVTTRKKAKEMLRKNKKPVNKSEQMIMNNYLTINHILEIKNEPITLEKFLEIHRLISGQTLDDAAGEGTYRDNNEVNVIDAVDGEIVHTPPAFEKIPELMDELFRFFNENDDKNFIHPIVKGCIIHFMIGYIHPFVDGNGRTARALFYWYLLKSGYWLTEYLSISRLIVKSKTQYALAYLYSETDDNDITYFIHFKIKIMLSAYEELKKYLQRKIIEKKQLINFQKIEYINERQALILKWIFDEPEQTFTVKEIQVRFNISNQTARTDLDTLTEMGFIKEKNINKKTKLFYKSDEFGNILKKYTQHYEA
jgi:Fic family protein